MKPLTLLCAVLLATPVFAEDPAAKVVDLKAPQAIELVKKEAAAAKADPKKAPLTVLDVRTPEEYAKGHLAGAKNVDFHDDAFKDMIAKLDKSQPYLVHCAAGGRSAKARDLMKALGFQNIFHLEGGMTAWQKAGGPVVEAGDAPAKP